MKKLLVAFACLAMALGAYAQGQVNFNTYSVGVKVFDADGVTPLAGTDYLAQLYAADGTVTDATKLTAVGSPVNFRSGNYKGYVMVSGTSSLGSAISPLVTVSPSMAAPGGVVTLQLRAWQGTAVTSYENAVTAKNLTGASDLFQVSIALPGTPPNLTGLKSFSLVPEPTTIALGVMGAAALLFRRRK